MKTNKSTLHKVRKLQADVSSAVYSEKVEAMKKAHELCVENGIPLSKFYKKYEITRADLSWLTKKYSTSCQDLQGGSQ